MNSEQLTRGLTFLNKCKNNHFQVGVFAADRIPTKYKRPAAFIINTDDYGQPGTHWIAIFIPKKASIEYFDSYGLSPYIQSHRSFLKGKKWIHNDREMQSLTSTVCGHYCLLFLASRMNGFSLQQFKNSFTSSVEKNDLLMLKYVTNMFKHAKLHTCKNNRLAQMCCSKL